jgi:hypothetical protein
MTTNVNPIDVEILEANNGFFKVKVPFIDVPVEMNSQFFNKRLECGYFNVLNKDILSRYLDHHPSVE